MRNHRAFTLLAGLLAGCANNPNRTDSDLDGVKATMKTMAEGDQIEDCVSTVATFDTGGADTAPAVAWCPDVDLDGYTPADSADPFFTGCMCLVVIEGYIPSGWVDVTSTETMLEDCDDTDAAVTIGTVVYTDSDLDGYGLDDTMTMACNTDGYVTVGGDCDDGDASINPGATEICNDVDDNCDSLVDDDAVDMKVQYPDTDTDGYGDITTTPVESCDVIEGYVLDATDCDDGETSVNPGATEVCDDMDNDCDGLVDDEDDGVLAVVGGNAYYTDMDSDGYGDNADAGTWYCDDPGDGGVTDATDCDDGDSGINPGATEIAGDGIDQDCDGSDTAHSASALCVTPLDTADYCELHASNMSTYAWTPEDPHWETPYAVGYGELCTDELPFVSGDTVKVQLDCWDATWGYEYWGWEIVGVFVSSVKDHGVEVSVTNSPWDEDGDGVDDGSDGVFTAL